MQEVQSSEVEAEEILASRAKAKHSVMILKPYYNAGSVTKTHAEDGVATEDRFKLDYLAPFLPQANVRTLSASQAIAARDACYKVPPPPFCASSWPLDYLQSIACFDSCREVPLVRSPFWTRVMPVSSQEY